MRGGGATRCFEFPLGSTGPSHDSHVISQTQIKPAGATKFSGDAGTQTFLVRGLHAAAQQLGLGACF